ncbi:hypothetical protein QR680_001625 [Steinernema hermaphroditum]|uniref:RGS domain-containing protein n=1 Tax=Steinernema hermaphroditum TaxID=289476 RepID=A0AA39H1Y1_9BILA|nr:hypothetical protein QR680_001625 [Steinernema hermaphroditum]
MWRNYCKGGVEFESVPTKVATEDLPPVQEEPNNTQKTLEEPNSNASRGPQAVLAPRKKKTTLKPTMQPNMFEKGSCVERPAPQLPSTDGIEYPRAAAWSSSTVRELLRDAKGRQLFHCFLHEALAEENLLFVDSIEKYKKMTDSEEKSKFIKEFLGQLSPGINISSVAMKAIQKQADNPNPDSKCFDQGAKEVYKLLENDQFPRFRRSDVYLKYLEALLPRSYAERWETNFQALLGNQIGRHYFRRFLREIHAEENLKFWEAVVEFHTQPDRSVAMQNMARSIFQEYFTEGTSNEIFLPYGMREMIARRVKNKEVDMTLFDGATKHIEEILKNDPYVRFLQSKEYRDLLDRLN